MEPPPFLQVLFLEDDADTREMVTVLLRQSDIAVAAVGTAGEVLIMAGTKPFNAFMLDGITPNGDSVRLCKLLKSRFPERPVVFYTGLADSESMERAMSAGAAGYIVKPYFGDLAKVLNQTIGAAMPPTRD